MTQEKDMNARNEALNDIESLPKIKGWIARDRFVQWTSRGPVFDGIGALVFYRQKPEKQGKYMWYAKGDKIHLDKNEFPDLKYEDGPIEIELIIRKV
jgi:hypothetical protein